MCPKPIIIETSDGNWIAEKHPTADSWQIWDRSDESHCALLQIFRPWIPQHELDQLQTIYDIAHVRGVAVGKKIAKAEISDAVKKLFDLS